MNAWTQIWQTLQSEFSDIPDLSQLTTIVVRLTIAALLGGILGFEREKQGKAAGVRTHMLVALGAAIFVFVPQQMGTNNADLTRVLLKAWSRGSAFSALARSSKETARDKFRDLPPRLVFGSPRRSAWPQGLVANPLQS